MLALTNAQKSLLKWTKTHKFATLWKIERTDGTTFYFTDHSHELEFGGNTYTPVGGFDASARQKQSGLQSRNLDVVGVIDSDAITNDDLRAGRYRDAEITEYLVDWQYPWAGAYATYRYWIVETSFADAMWKASISGLARWLQPNIGDVLNRTCRHVLGDSGCMIDLDALEESFTIQTVDSDNPRKQFTTDLTQLDDYFQFGNITMTSGDNDGLDFEVQAYRETDGEIYLVLAAPYDFTAGDTGTITPGCNKTTDHCKYKEDKDGTRIFNNIVNFGGFPTIPGNDEMLRTPNAK